MREAAKLARGMYPFRPTVERDELGHMRLGFGRRVETRPISRKVAQAHLVEDMEHTAEVLRPRVFELKAQLPNLPDGRIAVLYLLADLLGAEETRAWNPLWAALTREDWPAVTQELLTCHMLRVMAQHPAYQRQVSKLIVMMLTGSEPKAAA